MKYDLEVNSGEICNSCAGQHLHINITYQYDFDAGDPDRAEVQRILAEQAAEFGKESLWIRVGRCACCTAKGLNGFLVNTDDENFAKQFGYSRIASPAGFKGDEYASGIAWDEWDPKAEKWVACYADDEFGSRTLEELKANPEMLQSLLEDGQFAAEMAADAEQRKRSTLPTVDAN